MNSISFRPGLKRSIPESTAACLQTYADKAFDEFLRLAPAGIGFVHVVTAVDLTEIKEMLPSISLEEAGDLSKAWTSARVTEENDAMVKRLKEAGFEATCSVFLGDTRLAIEQAMSSQEADLLVLGAQGHGFLHRFFIGSTSLHQVIAEPHSILLLRPGTSEEAVTEEAKS